MKVINLSLLAFIVLVIITGCALKNSNTSKNDTAKFTEINKLVKVDWSNEGSYILFYDPSDSDTSVSNSLVLSFAETEDKDLFYGQKILTELKIL